MDTTLVRRPRQTDEVRYGIVVVFAKGPKKTKVLYCSCATEGEATRALKEVEARLPRGKPLNYGWTRLVLDEDFLMRHMPRRSLLAEIFVEEINGVR